MPRYLDGGRVCVSGVVKWGIYPYISMGRITSIMLLFTPGVIKLDPGGPCPAEFSSNLPQHTCMEASSMCSKTLISCFRCVWLGLELNSAGHQPSRTISGEPWFTRSSRIFRVNVGSHAIVFKSPEFPVQARLLQDISEWYVSLFVAVSHF